MVRGSTEGREEGAGEAGGMNPGNGRNEIGKRGIRMMGNHSEIIDRLSDAAEGILRGGIGAMGGIISWIGGLILLFGAYSMMGGGGFSLALLGGAVACIGEAIVFAKGLSRRQREALEEGIVGELLKGMAFPALWLAIYYLSGMELILAFAFSTGISAIIRSARITASFYTF